MAEYLEREALLRELRLWHMHKTDSLPDHFHYTGIKAWLEALPAEDVQPIVRCKDCKLYDGVHNARGVALCRYWMHMTIWDDYCSNGMRVEELAEFIEGAVCPPQCYIKRVDECQKNDCVPCWLAWLKDEVTDG